MRRIIGIALTFIVSASLLTAAHAQHAPMEPAGLFNPLYWQEAPEGKELYRVWDSNSAYRIASSLNTLNQDGCNWYSDPCTMDDYPGLNGEYLLGQCEAVQDPVCLEEMSGILVDGANIPAVFDSFYQNPYEDAYTGNRPGAWDLGIPEGKVMSIWRLPGVVHSGGSDRYLLKFYLYWIGCQNGDFARAVGCEPGQPIFQKLSFDLIPFSLHKFDGFQDGGLMPANTENSGRAGVQESFPNGLSLSVKIRAPKYLSGWVRMRAENATVDSEPISDLTSRISIQATPTVVPGLNIFSPVISDPSGNEQRQVNFDPSQLWVAEKLRVPAQDRSSGELRVFGFTTMESPVASWFTQCKKQVPGLVGYVASNSMFYKSGAPEFKNGSLSYSIAGMHYLSDGSVAKGNYELIINKEFAKCLYGVQNLSPSATIQVINSNGVEEVAVASVSDQGDWISLRASNFTFSTKEVRVTLREKSGFAVSQKTLTAFSQNDTGLNSKQKAQVRAAVDANPSAEKFICTGIRFYDQPMSANITVGKRAKAACNYAKQLNPNLSTWYQSKATKARLYAGKVLLTLKSPND